jgi:iron complex transport system permease protein
LLGLALVLILILSMFIGRYPSLNTFNPSTLMKDELALRLLFNLRLPRLLTAALLGMTLSAAGFIFQMIFSNPLVEPGFLGVSQGAAFGAAFAIIFLGHSAWLVQGTSTFFALLGLALSYLLARRIRLGGWILRLVLTGIAVSAMFSSGLGILKYMADPLSQLPEITFWLLGGLWSITWARLLSITPAVLLGLIIAYRMRWRLNLLSLNDETAFSLGAQPVRERALLLGGAVLGTAAVISVAGMIGWVGLIIPHISRRLFGADARFALPATILTGGIFTVICDDLARTLLPGEIPLGILTSLIGAAFFVGLMVNPRTLTKR